MGHPIFYKVEYPRLEYVYRDKRSSIEGSVFSMLVREILYSSLLVHTADEQFPILLGNYTIVHSYYYHALLLHSVHNTIMRLTQLYIL